MLSLKSRITKVVSVLAAAVVMTSIQVAPADAAFANYNCNLANQRSKGQVLSGNLELNSWYSSSTTDTCWIAQDHVGGLGDYIVKITKTDLSTGVKTVTNETFNGVYRVGGAPNTKNKVVDVEVWYDKHGDGCSNCYDWAKITQLVN